MHCIKRCKIISEHVGFERDWLNKNVFFSSDCLLFNGSSTFNGNNCKVCVCKCSNKIERAALLIIDKENMDEVSVLLFHSVGHQLLLGALGADDVLTVRDEALSHLRRVRADVQTFSHQERSREIETR